MSIENIHKKKNSHQMSKFKGEEEEGEEEQAI